MRRFTGRYTARFAHLWEIGARGIVMKAFAFLLCAAAVVALVSIALPTKGKISDQISALETLSNKMERAKQITPQTEQAVTHLIELVRAGDIQADSSLERRRQAAISRSERILAKTATFETVSTREH